VNPKSGQDLTDVMTSWTHRRLDLLEKAPLSGFILKKDSPSCGMERVRVHQEGETPHQRKASACLPTFSPLNRWPTLPVEEDGRLNDSRLRENFIERVFAYHRLESFFGKPWTVGDLVRFHTNEKLLLMAHEPVGYQELGRLVATAKGKPPASFAKTYRARFMEAMKHLATTRRHANVLSHAAGYLREVATPEERRELLSVINDFQRELVPLVAPIVLTKVFRPNQKHRLPRQPNLSLPPPQRNDAPQPRLKPQTIDNSATAGQNDCDCNRSDRIGKKNSPWFGIRFKPRAWPFPA
jgi:uncharacterized protein YbgA (DUF1722 family)